MRRLATRPAPLDRSRLDAFAPLAAAQREKLPEVLPSALASESKPDLFAFQRQVWRTPNAPPSKPASAPPKQIPETP